MSLIHTPLFGALTQPRMVAGVTPSIVLLNAAVATDALLLTRSWLVLPIMLAIHAVSYRACRREPRAFDLWLTRLQRCPRVANRRRWGGNSYRP